MQEKEKSKKRIVGTVKKSKLTNKGSVDSKDKVSPKSPKLFLVVFSLVLLSILLFLIQGDSFLFYVVASITFLVIIPNIFWLKQSFAQPFIFPYILTMVKTKKFINFIHAVVHYAWILEKISFLGLFLGFGLTYVDYWKARKLGGWKRIALLLIFSIFYTIFFWGFFTVLPLFSTPALAPLYFVSLFSFIILGFGGFSLAILLGYGFIAIQSFFISKQICPSVAPVIPGVPVPGFGVVVPFIAWISFGMILVIHEGCHGIMMSYFKKKIHSVGLLMAGLFPMGAFVEQDDKEFDNSDDNKILLMLSAGPSSNLATMIFAVIFLILFSFALTPFAPGLNAELQKTYDGVGVKTVQEKISYCGVDYNAPAKGNFLVGDKVLQANGLDVNNAYGVKQAILFSGASGIDVNFLVERNDSNVFLSMKPVNYPDLNLYLIGVEFEAIKTGYEPPLLTMIFIQLLSSFNTIMSFFVLLSFAVGTFNFLPSDPLDGGKMAKIILEPYASFMKLKSKEDTRKFIGRLFVWLFVLALLINLIPYITMIF